METEVRKVKKVTNNKISWSLKVATPISCDFEEENVISSDVKVYVQSVEPEKKQVKVNLKAVYHIFYNKDGKTDVYESASQFSTDFKNDKIQETSLINASCFVDSFNLSKSEDGLLFSSVLNMEGEFLCFEEREIVEGIQDVICKEERICVPTEINFATSFFDLEGEKQFDEEILKIISKSESVRILDCSALTNSATINGEIISEFLFLTREGKFVKDKLCVPFNYEIEIEGSCPEDKIWAFSRITEANYLVSSDENTNQSKISATYNLFFGVTAIKVEEISAVTDGFSTTHIINFEREEENFMEDVAYFSHKHHCFGQAICNFDGATALKATSSRVINVNYSMEDEGLLVTGEINCLVICKKEEIYSSCPAVLPFSFNVKCKNPPCHMDITLTGVTAKQQEEKCFLECDLILSFSAIKNRSYNLSCKFEEGEEIKREQCAIDVVFVRRGEDSWKVIKKANCEESELLKSNPELKFPIEEDGNIVIYRQLK